MKYFEKKVAGGMALEDALPPSRTGGATAAEHVNERRERPVVVHVTTTDISLELLLGPQLRAFRDAGYDVIAMSAPGPYVAALEADGIRHIALEHASRSVAFGSDVRAGKELYRPLPERCDPTSCTPTIRSRASTAGWRRARRGCP